MHRIVGQISSDLEHAVNDVASDFVSAVRVLLDRVLLSWVLLDGVRC